MRCVERIVRIVACTHCVSPSTSHLCVRVGVWLRCGVHVYVPRRVHVGCGVLLERLRRVDGDPFLFVMGMAKV